MKKKHTPYFYIIISFLAVIGTGTLLLWLPFSTKNGEGLSFINSLFMAVSSVCVTGLSVVANVGETLSIFGKVVMAILIEIGGLSFLTIAMFVFLTLGVKLGISTQFLMKEALNQNTISGVYRLIKRIILLAFSIQLVGTIVNLFVFVPYYHDFLKGLGVSIFHSISSFNNAGFDIFGFDNSMIPFANNVLLNINTMALIILGGIGFVVIHDILSKKSWKKLTIHSKVVILTTIVLIVSGFLIFKLTMWDDMSWLQALFSSVTARTAGFASFDMSKLNNPASILMCFLMLVGAGPVSTGGGLKVTTLFVIVIVIISLARGKPATVYKRKVAQQSIFKAFSLISFAIIFITTVTFAISCFEPNLDINKIIFEVVSAFGTVGLSKGITTILSIGSKIALCLTMFVGRLGPLTIIGIWNKNWLNESNQDIKYIEEKIIVG